MRRILYFFIIFFIICAPVCAAEFSISGVISLARQNNPTFKQAEATLKSVRQSYYSSYTTFLPQLSANAGVGESYSNYAGYSNSNSLGLSGSLSLFNGFADYSNIKIQRANLEIAEAAYKRTCADMVSQIKNDFYQLLWAQETIKLSEEILKMQKDNTEMLQLKYESGTEDLGSLKRTQADEYDAEFQLAKATRYLQGAQVQLINDIGDMSISEITVTGDFEIEKPDSGTPLSVLVHLTPEYLISLNSFKKADWGVTSARSELLPSVSLTAGDGTLGSGSSIPLGNYWNLGLTATYSFFPGGKNFFDVSVASLNRRAAAQALIAAEHQLTPKLKFALNNLFDTQGNRDDVKHYLDASQLQLSIVTQDYINGLETYQTWYIIENDVINFKRSYLNSQLSAALAMDAWKDLLGLGE